METHDRAGLKLLHVIKSLGRGGAEMLLLSTHQPLERLGVRCEYAYFLPWKDALVGELRDAGGRVHLIPARTSVGVLLAARRLASLVRSGEYDLLHCHLPLAGVAGRIAGRLTGTPVVYTEHNLQERYRRPTRWLNARTWRWQEQVVAVSAEVERSILASMGEEVPVRTVANGVDTNLHAPDPGLRAEARGRLGLDPTDPVIGTVAVFRTQKRLDRWLQAAALLLQTHPALRLLIVGDGPEKAKVLSWAQELGIRERLYLPGLQDDVRPYLAAMDIYMLSSDFEGLPVAVLEAMSMEVPVVSTRVGGVPEAVRDGRNGTIVESSEPEALATACARLLDDLATRKQYGVESRRTVQARFSVERMAAELCEVYRDALAGRGSEA